VWDIRIYVLENSSANPLEGGVGREGPAQDRLGVIPLDATTFEHKA